MKDESLDLSIRSLPPCPLSSSSLRLIDVLDRMTSADDHQDEGLVEQLRVHIPTCPRCAATLAYARQVRTQQRRLLQDMLKEGEQRVPSTTASILSALRHEQQTPQQAPLEMNHHQDIAYVQPGDEQRGDERQHDTLPTSRRSRQLLRNVLSLVAVAALVVASLGLFSRLMLLHSKTGNTPTTIIPSTDWSSVVITFVHNGNLTIANYDPVSGKSALLASSQYADGTATDGVSHDGHKLLYHVYDGSKTYYYLQPQPSSSPLYTFPGRGGEAIWSTDDHYVFINTPNGVEQVNTLNGAASLVLPSLKARSLWSYHDGYVYFFNSNNGVTGTLDRASIAHGDVKPITSCPRSKNFWLSPGGLTIYYICLDDNNLYAVNSDGTHAHVLRTNAGPIIGYDADSSPLTLMHAHDKYQVIKLGTTSSQDRVVLDDVAPHALSITAEPDSVAVAPYGHALVVRAMYGNSPDKLWYGNLITGEKHVLSMPASDGPVHLLGWDRLQVSGTIPSLQPTPTMVQSFSGWHDVLIAGYDSTGGRVKLTNYDTHNESNVILPSDKSPLNTQVDGISPDGKNVLYHYSSGGKTLYHVLARYPQSGLFYQLDDAHAGNTLWMPDSRHVLVLAIGMGVIEVDTQTGQAQNVLSLPLVKSGYPLQIGKLTFYRDGYVYFVGAEGACQGILCRVQLNASTVQQVSFRQGNTLYWLSPSGSTIYFANTGSGGQSGIYAVNNDGTNLRLLRPYPDGRPMGYAADGSLMIMRYRNGVFQVVKLGATAEQDMVVSSDVVPGAISLCDSDVSPGVTPICDSSIALAPLGGALVVEAGYATGSHKVWSISLKTGQRLQLTTFAGQPGLQVQLVGWDQIPPP